MSEANRARTSRLATAAVAWLDEKLPVLRKQAEYAMKQTTDHVALLECRAMLVACDRLAEEAKRDIEGGRNV